MNPSIGAISKGIESLPQTMILKLGFAAKTQFLWENFKPDVNFQLICLTGYRSRTAKINIKHETL